MKRMIIIVFAVICCIGGYAKEPQQPTSYNYQRGIELIQNEDLDEGIKFLGRELEQNPKNGYAYAWIASVYAQQKERGNAIGCLDKAIKYLPKNDKYYIAWAYNLKGKIYVQMKDTVAAIDAFTKAIKTEPKNDEWYMSRGILYSNMKQWEKSDADYQKIIELSPGAVRGYLMLADNLYEQERYEEALEKSRFAHQLAERSYTYSHMAQNEIKLGRYEQAVSHMIEALKQETVESTCMNIISECKDEEFVSLLTINLNVQIKTNPNSAYWYYYLLRLQQEQKLYEDAILTCNKIRTINPDSYFTSYLSGCYRLLGDWHHALQYINEAIEEDSTENEYRQFRTDIYMELDSIEPMFADYNYLIDNETDNAEYYFRRGRAYFFLNKYQQALDDYNTGIALDGDNEWERYMRGRCYEALGEIGKAKKEFERAENSKRAELRMFAKAMLGKRDEVLTLADSLLRNDTIDNKYSYNVACAYALINEKELALNTLEKDLKDDYVHFAFLHHDIDFQNIQGEEFEQLIQKYEQKVKERVAQFNLEQEETTGSQRIVEVPFTAANGVTKVDCSINGLPLNFVFDTGASDVTISQVEANFMFKNGYLTGKDVIGQQRYQTADGNISVGTTINLNKINFCGLELTNVRASVVKSQNAPLLLGQSVLQRLGKIEIDNERRILKITTR